MSRKFAPISLEDFKIPEGALTFTVQVSTDPETMRTFIEAQSTERLEKWIKDQEGHEEYEACQIIKETLDKRKLE